MNRFDLNDVLSRYPVDLDVLAAVLFPNVRYQRQALDRVMKGTAELDTTQVCSLADYLGVTACELFMTGSWAGSSEDGCLVLKKGEYTVKLNYKGVYLSLFRGNELIHQELANVPGMTVGEFTDYLDNLIKQYENGKI